MFSEALRGVDMATKVLRLPEVRNRTGLSKSSIYLHIKQGSFPRPIPLGVRSVGWLEGDVESWLEQRISAARARPSQ